MISARLWLNTLRKMIFAVDFDGTCVTHEYPNIGKNIGAEKVLRNLVKNGHKIILYTMRSHKPYGGRDLLEEAVRWFKWNEIDLYGVNENPDQKEWTDSPKPIADIYIDDRALGCPLKVEDGRTVVDWSVIDNWFKQIGLINTMIL